jgi:two-component system KDP operon response regulator KdpE
MTASDLVPILVIDDEPPIRRLLRTTLAANGFQVLEAGTGRDGIAEVEARRPNAILLDLGLPDIGGIEVIRTLRGRGDKTPIVVLSSRGDEAAKVVALDLGADDYVTKPFGIAELMARIRAALRHRLQEQGAEPVFESGRLRVDLVHRRVEVAGAEVKLSPKEYDILRLMVLHAGKVLTHRFIMSEIWGAEGDVQYLRIYVRQLRAKIEARPEQPEHILTETGVGYRLQ